MWKEAFPAQDHVVEFSDLGLQLPPQVGPTQSQAAKRLCQHCPFRAENDGVFSHERRPRLAQKVQEELPAFQASLYPLER